MGELEPVTCIIGCVADGAARFSERHDGVELFEGGRRRERVLFTEGFRRRRRTLEWDLRRRSVRDLRE